MKKLIALVFFFGFFGVATAQLSPSLSGQDYQQGNSFPASIFPFLTPLALEDYWGPYRSLMQPAMSVLMPNAMRAINAVTRVITRVITCATPDELAHCRKQGQESEGEPNGAEDRTCSTSGRCHGVRPGHRNFSRNPCRPTSCSAADISSPVPQPQPLSVKDTIGPTPTCPNRRISLDLEITGGTKNYSISIDNRIVSSSNIGFFSTEKNTSQSVRVAISDSSSPKKTWNKTITLPACRQPVSRCDPFKTQSTCEAVQCFWELMMAPCPLGFICASGGRCRDSDPYGGPGVACTLSSTRCELDDDCHNTPKTPTCIFRGSSNTGVCGSASCPQGECLSSSSKIATPIGDVAVTSLKVGDIVWTADAAGNRVVRSLIKVSRVPAPNHRVVHLVLVDGRSLDVSALHPTADGRTVGDLRIGDTYDSSVVKSATLKAYKGTATHDILPAGDTGYYWANGILMGSTLK